MRTAFLADSVLGEKGWTARNLDSRERCSRKRRGTETAADITPGGERASGSCPPRDYSGLGNATLLTKAAYSSLSFA